MLMLFSIANCINLLVVLNHSLTKKMPDVSVLILVLNAAKFSPTMIQMFPEHVVDHYTYLRDSLPHLVPQLKVKNLK